MFGLKNRGRLGQSVLAGIGGGLGLILFYIAVTYLVSRSWEHVIGQWQIFGVLMSLLVLGFAVQVGLFWYLRSAGGRGMKGAVGVSGGSSGLAMVACCAHHAADLAPLVGFSALTLFIAGYQRPLLVLALAVNLLGIVYMVNLIRKKGC